MNRVMGLIIVLAVGLGFLLVFILRLILSPRRVEAMGTLIKQGKTGLVISSAKRLIARNSKNAEAHYYLGLAYHAEKKEEDAYREFKILNQLSIQGKLIPEQEYRQTLAQLYSAHGESEEALKEYLLLIKLSPRQGEFYYQAGKIFAERGKGDRAREYLQKAAELSPKDGDIYCELGLLCYKEKKAPEAKAALERALRFQKEDRQGRTWFYLGKLQKDVKDYEGAQRAFDRAARDPEFRVRALVERGGCFMATNDVNRALQDLEKAVAAIKDEGSNDSLFARYFLGLCYEKRREIDKALAQWEQVYAQKKGFKDVGEKLSQYREFKSGGTAGEGRRGDDMRDYVTASNADFMELCKAIVKGALELQVQSARGISGGSADGGEVLAIEGDSGKFARKVPHLIRFYRDTDPADEGEIRSILDDAKEQNIPKAVVIASAGFSPAALEFANSRPVELVGKDKLRAMLRKAVR
ncbi:MAG: tetratricopeptide repeat protein [Treponema sp.]|jgi:tetratricopeptide (TPR) repeat protein|nr:tetratricopeptide repeat protein [Treponema sp.]